MIKHEGAKWILYSKDGKKVLGRFDSEAAAKKHEGEVQYFKHAGEGETMLTKPGLVALAEGDLMRMTDEDLRAKRKELVDARTQVQTELNALGDNRYTTADGQRLYQDVAYYDRIIYQVESEMACRMLTL